MSDRKGILGAGNWIVDHVKVIDALAQPGHIGEYHIGIIGEPAVAHAMF